MQNKIYYLNRNRYVKKQSKLDVWLNRLNLKEIIITGGMIGIWIYVLVRGISG